MKLGTTYICVEDIEKSLNFYRALLQQEPLYCNDDRWISFACGISLYNRKYDEKLIREGGKIHFNQAYLKEFNREETQKKNNILVLNFETEDLEAEHKRLKALSLGKISEILFM